MAEAKAEQVPETPRLVLPCEDKEEWSNVERVLNLPVKSLCDIDEMITMFHRNTTQQKCTFFSTIPGTEEAGRFDFEAFKSFGVPLIVQVALEMPVLFDAVDLPLLLKGSNTSITLTRRQVACLLAHSFFGSITSNARRVRKEKWAFRAAQLFLLQALPSAFCFLKYFTVLGEYGIPEGSVTYERCGFPRGAPPWTWEGNPAPLCEVDISEEGRIEDSRAELHADFANRFVGGGCLENDFFMEEILFITKPELVVAMALCSYLHDEEVLRVAGALQYSSYTGYGHSYRYLAGAAPGSRGAAHGGESDNGSSGSNGGPSLPASATALAPGCPTPPPPPPPPPTVCAMDALQGCAKLQFAEGLVRRDLNKARQAFAGATSVASGNWGCGAFGNDHVLKFLQQWLAASDAGATWLHYHTFGDRRCAAVAPLSRLLRGRTVGEVWAMVCGAAAQCALPGPGNSAKFRRLLLEAAAEEGEGEGEGEGQEEGEQREVKAAAAAASNDEEVRATAGTGTGGIA